jgi:hypothetical protein
VNRNLTYASTTVVGSTGAAAGTTLVTGASVKMGNPNFSAVRAIVLLGTLTAGQQTRAKLQVSVDNTTFVDLAGTGTALAADGDGGKLLITEAFRPGHPSATGPVYVRAAVERGTANAAITAIILEQFLAVREPVTQDASVSSFVVKNAPTPGTA